VAPGPPTVIPCLDLTWYSGYEDAPAVVVADQDATVWTTTRPTGPPTRLSPG